MVIEGDEEKSVGEPFRSYRSSGLANLSDGILSLGTHLHLRTTICALI